MKPVTIIRHIACEGPGTLMDVLNQYNIPVNLTAIDAGDSLPEHIRPGEGLVIMGGPMSVNDDEDWIRQETQLIQKTIAQGSPVLGHCLGGQFIAKALGANISKNPVKEIGWLPVTATSTSKHPAWLSSFIEPRQVFHWHGETFDIPKGATRLLSSEYCDNQAFIYNENVLAFQCHIEMTGDMINEWSSLYTDEIAEPCDTIQSREQMLKLTGQYIDNLNRTAASVYEDWIQYLS